LPAFFHVTLLFEIVPCYEKKPGNAASAASSGFLMPAQGKSAKDLKSTPEHLPVLAIINHTRPGHDIRPGYEKFLNFGQAGA
jgi:hypothetical protein